MSEAKFQVGDEVIPGGQSKPLKIVQVVTCYRFAEHGALWLESELTPYVRPLAVGDRVRNTTFGDVSRTAEVIAVRDDKVCVWCEQLEDFRTWRKINCERIPTEAGQ